MSKKGKRLREFENRNKDFSVRESKKKEIHLEEVRDNLEEYQRRQENSSDNKGAKKRKINISRLVASTVIIIFIVSVGVSTIKLLQLKGERDKLAEKNAELEKTKEDLTAELEHIDSAEYIEQQARKTLRLIKENEILFILPSELDKETVKDGQAEKVKD